MPGKYTLGIEEEFQLVDAVTGNLRSGIEPLLKLTKAKLGEQVKAEFLQCTAETITGVCPSIAAGRAEALYLRTSVAQMAEELGMRLISAGTHPSDDWQEQDRTDHPRYIELDDQLQEVARSILIFGLHVHVGIEDRNHRIEIMNQARNYIPHVLALSSNSPFWQGRVTGYKSFRTTVWQRFPRSGLPDIYPSYAEFERYVGMLVSTNCIDDGKKIWWDLRPHAFHPTLEFRVCDMPATFEETIALAALFQALVARLDWMRAHNQSLHLYPTALLNENKWRAARYGLDGKLIDFPNQREVPTRDAIHELLDFVDEVVDDLGSRHEMNHLRHILDSPEGSGADRQIAIYEQTGDVMAVTRWLTQTTMQGVTAADPTPECQQQSEEVVDVSGQRSDL
ncbi:MAG TPA: carboxylate-amine ligase [Ktedonobacterales bacterium]|nr:carboxylate-amine ligase [Ktedonobacterales bacterium]